MNTVNRNYEIEVKKTTVIEAEKGVSIWIPSVSYTHKEHNWLIQAVSYSRHGAVKNDPDPKKHFYTDHMLRRISFDNGKTWFDQDLLIDERDGFTGTYMRYFPVHFFDQDNGLLVSVCTDSTLDCAAGKAQWGGEKNIRACTMKLYYEISADGGKTWRPGRQIIHQDPQFNEKNWMPDITYGINGGHVVQDRFVKTDDGTIVLPMIKNVTEGNTRNIELCDHKSSKVVGFLLGKWNEDNSGIEWDISEYLDCPPEERPSGISEPDILYLGENRLFTTMRAMGTKSMNIPSVRMTALSEDGGKTWSQPEPLKYDDDSTVWVPACPTEFFTSSETGRIFWIGNIQPEPVYNSYPRKPLTIAEFDPERLCIIKNSIKVIWDAPEFEPKDRRYSNWGSYIDRETGEIVLTMPEEWKYSRIDYTADAIEFRIKLKER